MLFKIEKLLTLSTSTLKSEMDRMFLKHYTNWSSLHFIPPISYNILK